MLVLSAVALIEAENPTLLMYPAMRALAEYADFVGRTVENKVSRALFVSQAAAAICALPPNEAVAPNKWHWEAAEAALPSPLGAQELFGSVMPA